MPDQPLDPLANFLGDLAEKIKVTKEHKSLMEAVYASASATNTVHENNDPFASFLTKVGEAVSSKLPSKPAIQQITEIVEFPEEDKATKELGLKIKDAIEKAKTAPQPKELEQSKKEEIVQKEEPELGAEEPPQELIAVKTLGQKIKDAIEKAKNKALDTPIQTEKPAEIAPEEDEQIASYIDELEKLKDTGTVPQKEEAKSTLKELKEYIDKTVKEYSRRILDLGSGGGSVAVQYAKGGTMDGDLNVNGHILSGGKNIANYFGTGGGGGGGGDPAVNTAVYTGSAKWNSNYTTTNYYSAFWNAAVDELFTFYVTQTDPGSAFISEDGNYYIISNSKLDNVDLWNLAYTQIFLLSSRWDSVYVTVLGNSARWESVYTSLNQNSGRYESAYTTTGVNSGNWSSVYNTYRSLSASYAAETLAIAYAVAL